MANNEPEYLFSDEEETDQMIQKSGEDQLSSDPDAWKVLIVDDSISIHQITILAFHDFSFEGKNIEFLSAYSAEEAREMMNAHDDIALILLDVVMEEDQSGLKFVKYVREELKNRLTRIVMRTGQPGQAPEKEIIIKYDINDYKEKTELTQVKFFTTMVTALRSYRDLNELETSRKHLRLLLESTGRFVPHAFLRYLNRETIYQVRLGDSIEQEMVILFLDVRSYTLLSEKLTATENFNFINELLSYLEPIICEFGGFIDKYMGDAIMALFPKPVDRVIDCAIKIQKSLDQYNEYRKAVNAPLINIGISINVGPVIIGTIGFHDRMDCTAISDVVNTCAKVEKMNKVLGTKILISGAVMQQMEDKNHCIHRYLGNFKIYGKSSHMQIYEILLETTEKDIKRLDSLNVFEKAVDFFENRQMIEAKECFKHIVESDPDDTVAIYFLNILENGQAKTLV